MSFKDKSIRIDDWASNIVFIGPYDDPKVDQVLDANRCDCSGFCNEVKSYGFKCPACDDTGYKGDFEVNWIDESDKEDCNVYEYINY
jgi:hypothetical protein